MSEETKKLKVYVETSFVCYLTGDATTDPKVAADQAYTRQWWRSERSGVEICVSRYVYAECSIGREDAVARRLNVLDSLVTVQGDDVKIDSLAAQLISGHALPQGETTDALHIATAAVAGADVLLTWNCRHMANPRTLPKTIEIIEKAGFRCPWIMTPKTFLENMNIEEDGNE